jgi:hypothetical protein
MLILRGSTVESLSHRGQFRAKVVSGNGLPQQLFPYKTTLRPKSATEQMSTAADADKVSTERMSLASWYKHKADQCAQLAKATRDPVRLLNLKAERKLWLQITKDENASTASTRAIHESDAG